MSLRRIGVLIRGLPSESSWVRSQREYPDWTNTQELLATLIEVVDRGQLWWLTSRLPKGRKGPQPISVPRPWVQEPSKEPTPTVSPDEFFAGVTVDV